MGRVRSFLRGAAMGAGLMYFLDPQTGERRRAAVRDRFLETVDEIDAFAAKVMESAESCAGLRGGGKKSSAGKGTGSVAGMFEGSWSPTVRLAAGGLGTMLMLNCLARRTPVAVLMGTCGFGLFVRSLTNEPLSEAVEEAAESLHLTSSHRTDGRKKKPATVLQGGDRI